MTMHDTSTSVCRVADRTAELEGGSVHGPRVVDQGGVPRAAEVGGTRSEHRMADQRWCPKVADIDRWT